MAQSGQHYRPAVGELRDQGQRAAYGFDGFAQSREQKVAALLQPRDTILLDFQGLGTETHPQIAPISPMDRVKSVESVKSADEVSKVISTGNPGGCPRAATRAAPTFRRGAHAPPTQ